MDFMCAAISVIHDWKMVGQVRSDWQRGSFISSHAMILGSSLYATLVNVFTLVRTAF
jgi:hypothetical protein